ncbi:MAG: hypothetical protein ABI923_08865 [bacterium]
MIDFLNSVGMADYLRPRLMLLLLLLHSVGGAEANPQNSKQLNAICAPTDNSYECAQAIEHHQLRKPEYARLAVRTRNGLRLRLHNGTWLTVKDSQKKGVETSVLKFSFRDYLRDIGYFLLHRQYYEGDDYLLIQDTTGSKFELQDVPVISPDKQRLVTASNGISGGYNANAVQIWQLMKSGVVLEQSFELKGWAPSDPVWTDNLGIRLVKTYPGSGGKETVALRFGGRWQMESLTSPR